MHPVLKYMKDSTQDMLDMLKTLIEIESPSTNKQATDKIALHLRDRFAQLGCEAELLPQATQGDHVRVEFGSGKEQILVLCHMDTVWEVGEVASRPFRIEGERAYGPGVEDMKSGIVHTYFALKALQDLGLKTDKRIVVLLNSDEEIGSPSSRPLIEAEAKKSACVLVLEPSIPPNGAIKTFRKGVGMFTIEVAGLAAHAGADPEKGRSAILELAHQTLKLHAMNDPATGTSVNVGVVAGGTRSNVVAASASAEIDVRVTTSEEAKKITDAILGLKPVLDGTGLRIEGGMNRPPMERTPQIVEMYKKAKALAAELGFDVPEGGTGGGSDGNFTAALGVPTLDGLGAFGDGGHAPSEWISIPHMAERAALLVRLFEVL